MKIEITEAIARARNGQSLEGVVIDDFYNTQVKAKDALLLADFGIVIPEQNIYYDDADVAYDPEFDDVSWTRLSPDISLADQARMVAEHKTKQAAKTASFNVVSDPESKEINVHEKGQQSIRLEMRVNPEITAWIYSNDIDVDQLVAKLLEDAFRTSQMVSK